MKSVDMESDQYQLGKTKVWPKWGGGQFGRVKRTYTIPTLPAQVFVKNPESLFLLEEVRERKFDTYARRIQTFYRRWKAQQYYEELKQKVWVG